jgi:hypothetical protein
LKIKHQNEEECSKHIEQNSNKNNVNDSGRKPKGQSNKKNGKSGSIKASDNEASMRKEQNNLGQSRHREKLEPIFSAAAYNIFKRSLLSL